MPVLAAGGCKIYISLQSFLSCRRIIVYVINLCGKSVLIKCQVPYKYYSQSVGLRSKTIFVSITTMIFSERDAIITEISTRLGYSIVFCGDFNNDPPCNNYSFDFMKNEFDVKYMPIELTTLGHATDDYKFNPK